MTRLPKALLTKYPFLQAVRFFDVEASGLHQGSFPIQFGWCDLNLQAEQFLVKPHSTWTVELTDPESTKIHGIERQETIDHGLTLEMACLKLNNQFSECHVISDAPSFDEYWTNRLFVTANMKREFSICSIESVLLKYNSPEILDQLFSPQHESVQEAILKQYPHTHKADEDGLSAAACFRGLIDHEWGKELFDYQNAKPSK